MSSIDSVSASQSSAVYSTQTTSVKTDTSTVASTSSANASAGTSSNANSAGATVEISAEAKAAAKNNSGNSSVKKYADPDLVAKLKADSDQRTSQLKSIVEQLIGKQANASNIWTALREGKVNVDPATRAQAQADISEDGYWGVKQTSERILDFAKALAGDDPAQLEKMRAAFEKGYKAAEKTWGGQLPDISKQTYDAVLKGFDELTKKDVSAVSE